ncbi:MAG: hypothetical protein ACLQIB_46875 [Isosphaeraceae bacterium]
MSVVPVALPSHYQGLAESSGLLRDDGGDLVLEYQSKDAVVGILKSGVRQARIPRDMIASVAIEIGWFGLGTKVVIQTTSMQPIADVPGMDRGRLVLGVARKDRASAERLAAALSLPGPDSGKPAQFDTGLE